MKERLLWIALIALAFALGFQLAKPKAHSFTFEHRADGIYRYDAATGEIDALFADSPGWKRIVSSSRDRR